MRSWLAAVVLASIALVTPAAAGQAGAARPASMDWPGYGGDGSNMRYAAVSMISTANVARLRLAWRFHTGIASSATSFEATPVVAGGRLFIAAPNDEVFALDPTSGRLLWHFYPHLSPDAWPGQISRGVAYGDGRVYLATLDARLIALDAATGRLLWRYATSAGVDAAPSVYVAGGKEYVAVAAGGNQVIDSRRGDSLDVFTLG